MTKVSVIIPTFNEPGYLLCALDSVLNQTYKNLEIIIVDDGSGPTTRAALLPRLEQNQDIRYIYQDNKGPAAARNSGIAASTGEFIAFLDHDDTWMPDKVAAQMRIFVDNPHVGLVYCRFQYKYEDTGLVVADSREYCSGKVFQEFLSSNYIPTASLVMVRKACLAKSGTFDASLAIVDDYDFYLRLARYYEFAFSDECLVEWRRHSESMSAATIEMSSNRLKMRLKLLASDSLDDGQKQKVREALWKDAAELAYLLFKAGRLHEARGYFLKGIPYSPLPSMFYALCCCLPAPVVTWARRLKQSLHGILRRSGGQFSGSSKATREVGRGN